MTERVNELSVEELVYTALVGTKGNIGSAIANLRSALQRLDNPEIAGSHPDGKVNRYAMTTITQQAQFLRARIKELNRGRVE